MFRWFWSVQGEIPDGIGFGLFSVKHVAMLVLCAAEIFVLCRIFLALPESRQTRMLRILAVIPAVMECVKIGLLTRAGVMNAGFLPLHFCSFSLYVCLLHAFQKDHRSRFSSLLGEVLFVLLMPGALAALLFPDWSFYPLLNFMCLYSFLWHTLIVCYPVLLLAGGRIRPSIRHIWASFLFLALVIPCIWIFNTIHGTNYFFFMNPLPGTPLAFLYRILGGPVGWRIGYASLVILIVCFMYFLLWLGRRIRSQRSL
jgi:hypothetical integral membrane protein (TIGR02206 family)